MIVQYAVMAIGKKIMFLAVSLLLVAFTGCSILNTITSGARAKVELAMVRDVNKQNLEIAKKEDKAREAQYEIVERAEKKRKVMPTTDSYRSGEGVCPANCLIEPVEE